MLWKIVSTNTVIMIGAFLMMGAAMYGWASDYAFIDASQYASLQDAFDAVPDSGGLVKLPPGTFEIERPLILTKENTRVEGCGAATHIINRAGKNRPAIVLRHKDYIQNKAARVWRIQLADFRISGSTESGDGVQARGVNEIYVHGLSVDRNGGHGINLVDCFEDPRICDSIITYNGKAGLNLQGCHDIVVNGNQLEENQDAVRCIDGFNLCMNGNNLDDHLRHGVVIENTYGSVLSGNMIEECRGVAVIMDRDCYGNTVGANVIAHNEGGGVFLNDAWGCAVSANTFTINLGHSILVSPNSGRITITGNNFSNAYIGDGTKRDDRAAGILLKHTTAVGISGNLFSGIWKEAIRSEGECTHVLINDNIFLDGSKETPGKYKTLDLKSVEGSLESNLIVPD